MTTVALSTTPATLDPGTAYELDVVNSGTTIAHVQIAGGVLFDQKLKPGQTIRVHTGGQAVTAYARSGSGEVTTTSYTNPETAGGSGAYAPLTIAQRSRVLPAVPVADNCNVSGTNFSFTSSGTSRSQHTTLLACSDLRLVYTNWNVAANSTIGYKDADGPSAYTVRASIEYNGTIYRALCNGQITATIDPGGYVVFDAVGLDLPANTSFFVRTYILAASGTWFSTGVVFSTGGGWIATSDLTAPGSAAITTTTNSLYQPSLILGTPASKTVAQVALFGDSIDTAQSESNGQNSGQRDGYNVRGVRALGLPYVRATIIGDTVRSFMQDGMHARRYPLTLGCTHALDGYGTNDVSNLRTLAQVQADKLAAATLHVKRGMKVTVRTLIPRNTSTDSWATLANQTPNATESVRVAYNDWIRAGAPIDPGTLAAVAAGTAGALVMGNTNHPITNYIETADTVESSRNSGKWVVTGAANYATSDGTHPSSAGHALMAAAITASTFT